MIEGKVNFTDAAEAQNFILRSEAEYERQLAIASERILQKNPGIVTICGPSCSGKTTTAEKLVKLLEEKGKRVHTVSFDDFYLDRDLIVENCRKRGIPLEFESAVTLDLSLLGVCFKKISQGSSAFFPRYDFKNGQRAGFSRYTVHENDMFVFEGIQALYPEVSSLYAGMPHFGIYISVGDDIRCGDTVFEATTVRFLRRLVRDSKHRAASAQTTYEMWQSVRRNEEENIFPYIDAADLCVSSALAYEPNVIGTDMAQVVRDASPKEPCYAAVTALKEKLDRLALLPESMVPAGSVLREFID